MRYDNDMKKTEALEIFGGVKNTAAALQLTYQAVYAWPDELTRGLQAKVVFAQHELGLKKPKKAAK